MSLPESCRTITDLVDGTTVFDAPAADMAGAQLHAARDLFELRRGQIAVLDQRARDTEVTSVQTFDDLVPLLFSHTTYKSYPESFVRQGRWDRLTAWYSTLVPVPVDGIDFSGIRDVDDWVDRMREAGHFLHASSGTTGKCSFLNNTAGDLAFCDRFVRRWLAWPQTMAPDQCRRYYQLYPQYGPQKPIEFWRAVAENFGRPDARFYLGKDPMTVSQLNRNGAMHNAMANGTASAADIAAFEAETAARSESMQHQIEEIAEDIFEHRHEPLCITGMWTVLWQITEMGRARGIPVGDFHPETFVFGSGRKKMRNFPANAGEQVREFLGGPLSCAVYGMTELSTFLNACEAGRYHIPPWMIVLVLDREGGALVKSDEAVVEGRAGYLDLSFEGRWGGIITGDRIQLDRSDRCACGRHGPVILDSVARFKDLGIDDKIGCAGTFDSYVRGVMEQIDDQLV